MLCFLIFFVYDFINEMHNSKHWMFTTFCAMMNIYVFSFLYSEQFDW